jgi:excinuclease ABC subunit B
MRPVTDLQRKVAPFEVVTEMIPAGDQPTAIAQITERIGDGEKDTVLLGATGTGKTATVAWVAEQLQRPVLVMLPNKTLAAQFANELREMMPRNAVEYFVSYYDYYQPEAYIPQTDTYIEKDSSINDEVERLRHSATNSLLTRRDTIVVASVSCIYGLGTPQEYVDRMLKVKLGDTMERDQLLRKLVGMQYARNDIAFTRGTFRVRGDTIEIIPQYEELAVRIEMFGDEIERLSTLHPLTGEVVSEDEELYVFPATHYVAGEERMGRAIAGIEVELAERLAEFERQGKLLEAQRLRMRTTYDIEMMRQVGSCSGIENYSRHIDGREQGSLPRGLRARRRRVAPDRPADRRDVRGRRLPQADAGRPRLPAAKRERQPPADLGRVHRAHRPDDLLVRHARPVRAAAGRRRRRRAGDSPDRARRPAGHHQAHQGPDRRPPRGDQAAHRKERARLGHHADQEDVRGPHRLPA